MNFVERRKQVQWPEHKGAPSSQHNEHGEEIWYHFCRQSLGLQLHRTLYMSVYGH